MKEKAASANREYSNGMAKPDESVLHATPEFGVTKMKRKERSANRGYCSGAYRHRLHAAIALAEMALLMHVLRVELRETTQWRIRVVRFVEN